MTIFLESFDLFLADPLENPILKQLVFVFFQIESSLFIYINMY